MSSDDLVRDLREQALAGALTRRDVLKRAIVLGLSAPTIAGLLAACADDDDDEPAQPGTTPEPVEDDDEDEDAEEPEPDDEEDDEEPSPGPGVDGEEIIVGLGTDVVTVDARIVQPGPAKSQVFHISEVLVWPDNDGEMQGILVENWESTEDPPGLRFHLKQGITFSNGEPFNAESVKYTVDSIISDENADWVHADPRTRYGRVVEAVVEDEYTVLLQTDGFYRALLVDILQFPMIPAEYGAEQGREFGVNPVGTGPYTFVEYTSGSHLTIAANPDYHGGWGADVPRNPGVTFRYLPENATRIAALEAGEVHMIDNLPPDAVERIQNNPELEVLVTPTTRINGMFLHCNREPFNDLNARLAVAHAIDREGIVQSIMGGMTEVANAPFPPGTPGLAGQTFEPYEYDPDRAREYFEMAGLSPGSPIRIGGPVGRYINDQQIVQAVAAMVSEIGFEPELEQLEFGTYWPQATAGDYDMWYVGWSTNGFDPVDFGPVYTGWDDMNAGMTRFVEQNDRIVEFFQLANATASQEEAEEYYNELAHLIWDNVPVAQLFYEPNIAGISTRLQNWEPRRDTYVFMWDAYLE